MNNGEIETILWLLNERNIFADNQDILIEYFENCKRCSKCKTFKLLTEFHKNTNSSDGRQNYCKECNKKYGRKHMSEKVYKIPEKYEVQKMRVNHSREKKQVIEWKRI